MCLTWSVFHGLAVSLHIPVILLHRVAQIDPLILTHYSPLGESEVWMWFVGIDREILLARYLSCFHAFFQLFRILACRKSTYVSMCVLYVCNVMRDVLETIVMGNLSWINVRRGEVE